MAKSKRVVEAKTRFYKKNGEWRWQIKKGRHIIGASTEGYKNRIECRENYFEVSIETSRTVSEILKRDGAFMHSIRTAFSTAK